MEYQEYIEQSKNKIKNLTLIQRVSVIFLAVLIIGGGIFLSNPSKKLLEARNSQRRSDVVNILNSVHQYSLDNDGALPVSITSKPTMICKSDALSCDGLVDISEIIQNEKYLLSEVPVDPKEDSVNSSGYQIYRLSNGRISVTAPLAEKNAVISLSK